MPKLTKQETTGLIIGMARIFPEGLHIDVIPHTWYKALRHAQSGLVNLPAIVILADICYWWRPKAEEKETATGPVSAGYKKRFGGDRLQRSASWYEKNKGLTKDQVFKGLKFLEERNLIIVDLENVYNHDKQQMMNNVRFITPVPMEIAKITPLKFDDDNDEESVIPLSSPDDRPPLSSGDDTPYRLETIGLSSPDETNTEITNIEYKEEDEDTHNTEPCNYLVGSLISIDRVSEFLEGEGRRLPLTVDTVRKLPLYERMLKHIPDHMRIGRQAQAQHFYNRFVKPADDIPGFGDYLVGIMAEFKARAESQKWMVFEDWVFKGMDVVRQDPPQYRITAGCRFIQHLNGINEAGESPGAVKAAATKDWKKRKAPANTHIKTDEEWAEIARNIV